MNTEEAPIINRVANSPLLTIDLEDFYHHGERCIYDLTNNLYEGFILKEKDFREFLKTHDWSVYKGKNVAILCSTDAILPTWAYMLLVLQLSPHANKVVAGNLNDLENALFFDAIARIDFAYYRDKKVIIKGCSKHPVPLAAYAELTNRLRGVATSIMFGEPCSTVPLYKR